MSYIEILGWCAAIAGNVLFFLLCLLAIQYLAWWAFKEIVGWARIAKALRLLSETEKKETK
jgi:hypothetical protein